MSGRGAYYKAKYGGGGRGRGQQQRRQQLPEKNTEAARPIFDADGSMQIPYGGGGGGGSASGDISDLRHRLRDLEGQGYGAYGSIERSCWSCMDGEGLLIVDKVQRDAFAPPSRIRFVVSSRRAGVFVEEGRVAAADWLCRRFFENARRSGDDARTETGGWGGKKGGELRIVVPSQFVLERTCATVSRAGAVELRLTAALPASGRTIEGRWAASVLCDRLVSLVEATMCNTQSDRDSLQKHVDCVLEQQNLRSQLDDAGLCCFVGDGCVLPRKSGADDRPMLGALPFFSDKCGPLRTTLKMRDGTTSLSGLGFPKAAVSLVCGGGFHGKSTLLQALQVGCYDKIPGDGREFAVAFEDTMKIRSEDGRYVSSVDVSAFLSQLPTTTTTAAAAPAALSTSSFSTQDASGSTSQAAAIAEAMEVGARTLLFDEDSCATNFMIRDDRMRALVADECEPITPLVDRIQHIAKVKGIASILVLGGTGDYFAVADAVVVMDTFQPRDETRRAREIAATAHASSTDETTKNKRVVSQPPFYFRHRLPSGVAEPKGRCATRTVTSFQYGDNNDVDLTGLEQLVEIGQTAGISAAICSLSASPKKHSTPLARILDDLEKELARKGLTDVLGSVYAPDLSRPRKLEIAAALNRIRTAVFEQQQPDKM